MDINFEKIRVMSQQREGQMQENPPGTYRWRTMMTSEEEKVVHPDRSESRRYVQAQEGKEKER